MVSIHMTEAEVAGNFAAVLDKVRQGAEVIVERDAQPLAVIKAPEFRGRPIDECIAQAKDRGSRATLDDRSSEDLHEVIESHREPLDAPSWD